MGDNNDVPLLIPMTTNTINKKRFIIRPRYSRLARYRRVGDISLFNKRVRQIGKQQKRYYMKHMKSYRNRRPSHAGTWYSR